MAGGARWRRHPRAPRWRRLRTRRPRPADPLPVGAAQMTGPTMQKRSARSSAQARYSCQSACCAEANRSQPRQT
eukprot:4813727-Pleurochrysis_carterae.AAC.1